MIILDKPSEFTGDKLEFNFYHRAHVNLITNTKIWMCFIPRNESSSFSELIVSPIDFHAWEDVWRIVITLKEQVGIVNEILETIKSNSINILALETSSLGSQQLHSLELIVDARRYANTPFDKTYDERKKNLKINTLRDLKRQILSRTIQSIHFIGEEPRIKINRVYGLYGAVQIYNQFISKYAMDEVLSPRWSVSYLEKSTTKPLYPIHFLLPDVIRKSVYRTFRKEKIKAPKKISYLPVSDTKDRFLRIYFFNEADKIISFTLRHQEIVGAVATITSAIKSAGFNLLSSHSRIDRFGEKGITDFIVEFPGDKEIEIPQLKNELELALSTKELVQFYQIEICYPVRYNSRKDWKKIDSTNIREDYQSNFQTTRSRLAQNLQFYRKTNGVKSNDDKLRLNLIQKLIIEENMKEPFFYNINRIFISTPNENKEIHQIASSIAKKYGFEVSSEEDFFMSDSVKDEIKNRIEISDFFLGIWIRDKAISTGKTCYPSPSMVWELGVAEGNNKISRLIIENGIDTTSIQSFEGTRPNFKFSDNIEEQIDRAIRFFKSKADNKPNGYA